MATNVRRCLALSSYAQHYLSQLSQSRAPRREAYWLGKKAKEDAIDYAKAHAKYVDSEIRVVKDDGSVESVIRV